MSKVVIVTGATGGIGSAVAKRFGRDGYRVVVNYLRSADSAEKIVDEIKKSGGDAIAVKANVAKYDEVLQLVGVTVERWGRLDVVIANAGGTLGMLGRIDKSLMEHEESDWDFVLDVNLKGTFFMLKAAASEMVKQRDGHIVIVGSSTGVTGLQNRASYAAAKAGVFGLAKVAAREFGSYNIKINTVSPGLILHEGIRNIMLKGVPQLANNYAAENVLHRSKDNAEEFADFVLHLCSMKDISGQFLNLDSQILF